MAQNGQWRNRGPGDPPRDLPLERELVSEQDEAGLSIRGRADGRETIGAHLRPRAMDAVGEQLQRRDVAKIGRGHPTREIDPSPERDRHRAPLIVESRSIVGKGHDDRDGDAIDMDVELVLAPRPFRIDR